ncbi:MAG: hypothetical protein ACR2FY_16425 [Pirellulaceae bacterium]
MFCFLILLTTSLCAEDESGIKVKLLVDSRIIRQYDPVLVKIIVINTTDEKRDIIRPARGIQTLVLSVTRLDGDDDYEALVDADGFTGVAEQRFPIITLPPHGQFAAYDRVFRKGRFADFVFPHATSHKLRAGILAADKRLIYSEPVNISVGRRKEKDLEFIKENVELLRSSLIVDDVYITDPKQIPQLEAIRARLKRDSGSLPGMLRWRIPAYKFKYGTDQEREAAKTELAELRKTLSEPARDMLAISLAQVAVDAKDYAAAKEELARLKEESAPKRHLEFLIRMGEMKW